jgi:Transposase
VSMSNPADRVEIITSVQRRRRWTASEKVRIVEETFEPGMTVSLVARRHGVALVGEDDVPGLACLALPHDNHAGISVEIRNVHGR